jgi:hypothetical protein
MKGEETPTHHPNNPSPLFRNCSSYVFGTPCDGLHTLYISHLSVLGSKFDCQERVGVFRLSWLVSEWQVTNIGEGLGGV